MPALNNDNMAHIRPFAPLSRLFVNLLTLTISVTFLSAQPTIKSDQCYARQFIAYKEVTRNSETLVMELVVKDVASCIKLCCEQRAKTSGGCDAISFDRATSSCSLFRCSAFIACLPMNVKNSVNSYLFFTIPIPTTTGSPWLPSGTMAALTTAAISAPLSEFPILSCPRNYPQEDVAPPGKFIREVLLHDASACLSFCCRHSRETGCRSVLFRSDSFRCAMFSCANEHECLPMMTMLDISHSTAKAQPEQLTSPRETTTTSFTTPFFQNSGTTERMSRFPNDVDIARWMAAMLGQTSSIQPYSSLTLTNAPSSIPDQITTNTISDSALFTDTVSLTAAEDEKPGEQSVENGSTEPTAAAQTEVAAASSATSATASADSARWPTARFTNDGLSLGNRQITGQTPTDVTDATLTKTTDALIAHSSSKFDKAAETSFVRSSSFDDGLSAVRGATSPPQPSAAMPPFETTIDGDAPTSAAPVSDRQPTTIVTSIIDRKRIFTVASEGLGGATTAHTRAGELNRASAASTAGEQFEQRSVPSQNRPISASSRIRTSYATTIISNKKSTSITSTITSHLTHTTMNKEERSSNEKNFASGARIEDNEMLSADATQWQRTTLTNSVSEQQHTATAPVIYLNKTTIEATRSEANDKAAQSASSTLHALNYDYDHSEVDVSMESNVQLATVSIPVWMLSVIVAIMIALLTVLIVISVHTLRLSLRSGEYNLLKALSSRKPWR